MYCHICYKARTNFGRLNEGISFYGLSTNIIASCSYISTYYDGIQRAFDMMQ